MKVQPVASPHAVHAQQSPSDSKARAVAAFNKSAAPSAPPVQPAVQQHSNHPAQLNQNAIAPEEMTAVKKPIEDEVVEQVAAVPDSVDSNIGQTDTSEDPALSKQFAQLARQEKALRQRAYAQEQAWKAKEQALLAREQALTATPAQDLSGYIPKEALQRDPLFALAQAGVSYDGIVERMLEQTNIPKNPQLEATIGELRSEIKELKASREADKKASVDAQTTQYQAALRQIRSDVKQLITSDPNTYEAIAFTKSEKDVVDLIEQTYRQDGLLLSVEEAAHEVEKYLVDEGVRLTRIGKIKKQLETATAKPSTANQKTPEAQQPQMKTLTNATSSSRKLSQRERAILAFKGELKS